MASVPATTLVAGHGSQQSAATIQTLQVCRALAALAVVAVHAEQFASASTGTSLAVAGLFRVGYLGVDFFFVLSGFIIYHTYEPRSGRPGWAGEYISRRFTRIFIPYWPIGLAYAAGYTMMPGHVPPGYTWGWLASLTLLPAIDAPALAVAWTLQLEIIFYLVALGCLSTRRPLLWLNVWALVMTALGLATHNAVPVLSTLNLEFYFGVMAGWVVAQRIAIPLMVALGGALAASAAFALFGQRELFGLALACLLVPIVNAEIRSGRHLPRSWLLLGAASYAIYLVHLPAIQLATALLRNSGLPWLGHVSVLAITAVACGLGYHLLYEIPALELARHRLRRLIPALRRS